MSSRGLVIRAPAVPVLRTVIIPWGHSFAGCPRTIAQSVQIDGGSGVRSRPIGAGNKGIPIVLRRHSLPSGGSGAVRSVVVHSVTPSSRAV